MKEKPLIGKEELFIFILITLPILTFTSFLTDFIFPNGTQYSDYTISHYPNLLYLQQTMVTSQQIPLWNNQILSGFPMIANPLAGLWYPGNWLTILFPLPLGTHLVTLLHLISGGLGMYYFLRQRRNTSFASFLGAMAFELMPKLFIHYAAGHVSLVQAITWTPWLLLLQQRRYFISPRQARFWYQTGIVYALIFLCDLRWVAYAFMLDGVFFLYQLLESKHLTIRQLFFQFSGWGSQTLLGTGLSAIFLVPFFEYLALTDRSQLMAGDILNYGLPPAKLMGLIIPDMGGYAEYFVYPGLLVIIAFLGVLSIRPLRKKYIHLYIFIGFCLLYSFGDTIPWLSWIVNIPGMNLLRVPSRMFFMINVGFIVMAADYFSSLENVEDIKKQVNLLPPFFTLVFSGAILLVIYLTGNLIISDFVWPVLISFFLFILLLLKKYTKKTTIFVNISLVFVAMMDFAVVNFSQIDIVSAKTVFSTDQTLYDYFSQDTTSKFRIYSPSYRLEQQNAAYHQLELVDGIDPLHLKSYTVFMENATGVPYNAYSVTIPPYANGRPETDNENAVPDSKLLGLLNTKYVVSYYPIKSPGLKEVNSEGKTFLYLNENYRTRAWIESKTGVEVSAINIVEINPNRIQINAVGPGKLVLSELMYPGWIALINGRKVPIQPAHQILRSVDLPDGEALVDFRFLPKSLFLGAGISGISWFGIGLTEIITSQRRRKNNGN